MQKEENSASSWEVYNIFFCSQEPCEIKLKVLAFCLITSYNGDPCETLLFMTILHHKTCVNNKILNSSLLATDLEGTTQKFLKKKRFQEAHE